MREFYPGLAVSVKKYLDSPLMKNGLDKSKVQG